MAVLQYIGARYVPKLFKAPDGSMEWQPDTYYEPLTVVTYNGTSYISRLPVSPEIGNPAANPQQWANSGNYNAYVQHLAERLEDSLTFATPEQFGAKGDGITDDTEAIRMAIESGKSVLLARTYKVNASKTARIPTKNVDVEYAFQLQENARIYVTGTVLMESGVVFYSTANNISIYGGTYKFAAESIFHIYGKEVALFVGSRDCEVSGIYCNDSAVCCVGCRNMNVHDCTFKIDAVSRRNAFIGFHTTNDSSISKISMFGSCGDGDILLFTCRHCKVFDCNMYSQYYSESIDLGSQGICVDTACWDVVVSNNIGSGYYHFIDVKSDARRVLITGNMSYGNKCGITVRKGEQTGGPLNTQSHISIVGNFVDMSGNGATDSLPGSGGLYKSTIVACGIYVTDAAKVSILDNFIMSSRSITGIGIFLWHVNGECDIRGNTFNCQSVKDNAYISGIMIAVNNNDVSDRLVIEGNVLLDYSSGSDIIVALLIKNVSLVEIISNEIWVGNNALSFTGASEVTFLGNNIRCSANPNLIISDAPVYLAGNIIESIAASYITNMNLERGGSAGNVLKYHLNLVSTGCKETQDIKINVSRP